MKTFHMKHIQDLVYGTTMISFNDEYYISHAACKFAPY